MDDPKNILSVEVDIRKQSVQDNQVILNGDVEVIHYGDEGIIDLAALLTFLVNKNNTDASYVYLDELIGKGVTTDYIDFFFVSESVPIAGNLTTLSAMDEIAPNDSQRSSSEKTLIVVVTLLSITIIGMATVLCWIGGGWLALRKQVKALILREEELTRMTHQNDAIQTKRTEETDEENSPSRDSQTKFTNPSGILGVYGIDMYGSDKLQGLGIKTPGRSNNDDEDDDDLGTPMSTYSDTNRAPIGIMSMRKLVPEALQQQSQESSDDEHDQDEVDVGGYGTKKLEY
jgi:hypothetical protein